MRTNRVFISGMVLFEPLLTKLYHYNMIGFLTGKEKPNIVKIYMYGTTAIQFCREVNVHDLVHIEGFLSVAKIPKKAQRQNYIAPVVEVIEYTILSEHNRKEYIDVDFPKSITKMFSDVGQKYDPYFTRNLTKNGGNV
jgi:hypothetical protein